MSEIYENGKVPISKRSSAVANQIARRLREIGPVGYANIISVMSLYFCHAV